LYTAVRYLFLLSALAFSFGMTTPSPVPHNEQRSTFNEQHSTFNEPSWGFFAHRRINRLAVFILPPEMLVFYKKHIDWISDHAVDPDMRRYATKHEGPRHFIDLDAWGAPPFPDLPRNWLDAMLQHTPVYGINAGGDTLLLLHGIADLPPDLHPDYRRFFAAHVLPQLFRDETALPADSLRPLLETGAITTPFEKAFFQETLSQHGVLPWHLQKMQRDLTEAMRLRDSRRILRLSADLGHYIGDAHVPLHTTSNYNGQQTGQHGIHAFWESRIPELFADEQYDYFVGKAQYIPHTADFYWDAVMASHSMVDSVLNLEWALRVAFPSDRQTCPETRGGRVVLVPCRDYAGAYQASMNGMVERRLRAAILALGSAWYTAWVDAGMPDLGNLDTPATTTEEALEEETVRKMFEGGKILGRPEE
jgi:hypothetical protein